MTAVLPLANAGISYSTDPNTGLRRTGADEQALFCGGVDVLTATATGVDVTALTINGNPVRMVGEMTMWPSATIPALWLKCNGQTVLRASYPDLWAFAQAEIGAGNLLFTNGNGTTTFTVPDFKGRVPAGNDESAGRLTSTTMTPDGNTLGAVSANNQTVALSLAQLPTGITSVNAAQAISVTSLQALIPSNANNLSATAGGATNFTVATAYSNINSTGSNSISVTSNNTSGAAHPNVQPTIITNFIIYAGA